MKTSKEMQLKILDRMRENVENEGGVFDNIQFWGAGKWLDMKELVAEDFINYEIRVKPEKITINGVEIPVPLGEMEMKYLDKSDAIYFPCSSPFLFSVEGRNYSVQNEAWNCIAYKTKEEAIEASKALFGIRG